MYSDIMTDRVSEVDGSRHLNILVEQMPIILYTVDQNLTILSSCGKGLKALGLLPNQLRGTRLEDYLGTNDSEFLPLRAHRQALAGNTIDFSIVWQGRNFHTHLEPHRNEDGTVIGVIGLVQDQTERTKLQEELQHSQKIEAVGRLAGGIAHDFNNLLTAIMGCSEMLLDSMPANDVMRPTAGQILKASERAAVLTRQLLAFSRRQVLQPKNWNLNTTVLELEHLLKRLLGEHIQIAYRLAPDLNMTYADPSQMELVLLNLAMNARDAMPNGGTLGIETRNTKAGVELLVSDTGVGMTPEVRARLFEPFFSTKDTRNGVGLGLSTVYGTVQQSGGDIRVESEPGQGATFFICMPVARQKLHPIQEIEPAGLDLNGTETILLVEDEEMVRDWVGKVLLKRGYKVLQASDGLDGEQIAREYAGRIDLLISDVVMPHVSGIELAKRLQPVRPEIRCLFVSGYTEHVSLSRGYLNPEVNFLQKPFTPEILFRRIRSLLNCTARAS